MEEQKDNSIRWHYPYYKSTALSDLLGVPVDSIYDNRLYRGLDNGCCLTGFVGRGDTEALRDSSDGASGDSASVSGTENSSTVQKIILEDDVVKILGLQPKNKENLGLTVELGLPYVS